MRPVERDAFTEASGHPPGRRGDGILLRDRAWLGIRLGSARHYAYVVPSHA
jgi:hypothetical protein